METEVWPAMCLAHCRLVIAYTQAHTCTHHIQTRGFSLTSTMSHVAKMHLGNCPALKGFAGRRRGMGMEDMDRLVESALDLCVCNGAIYEETVAPFLQGELLTCHSGCCANISCLGAPAAIVEFSPSFPVSHPASLYTSFVKHTKEDRHTIEQHFSIALALRWCPDTG